MIISSTPPKLALSIPPCLRINGEDWLATLALPPRLKFQGRVVFLPESHAGRDRAIGSVQGKRAFEGAPEVGPRRGVGSTRREGDGAVDGSCNEIESCRGVRGAEDEVEVAPRARVAFRGRDRR